MQDLITVIYKKIEDLLCSIIATLNKEVNPIYIKVRSNNR